MGTTLTGKLIADTYDALLKVTDNNVITGIRKRLTDGFGNDTPLLISSTDVQIDGNFILPGTTSQYVRGDGSIASFPSFVTSVSGTGTVSGLTLTGTVTSSGSLTLGGSLTLTSGDVTSGLGYTPVPQTRTLTINGETYDLSANRSWTIAAGVTSFNTRTGAITLTSGDVTGALGFTPYNATNPSNYIALTALSASSPLSYNNLTGAFSIQQASGSQSGFLSSTDWTTFNNKQNALTNPITGTMTAGRVPRALTSTTLGDSNIYTAADETIGLMTGIGGSPNGAPTPHILYVNGNSYLNGNLTASGNVTAASIIRSGGTSAQILAANGSVITAGTNITISGGTISANNTSQWTTSGSNIYYNTGNVGIGTTSPSTQLHLNGSADIRMSNSANTSGFDIGMLGGNADANAYIYQRANSNMILATNNTERMRITSAGNVGIGTSSPASILNVSGGNITVSAGSGLAWSGDQSRIMTPEDNVSGALIQTPGIIRFNAGGSEKVRITSGGNVGIGTSSPQARLHSNSDILTGYFQNGTNGIYDALKLTNNTASNTLSGNGARIQFYNNANNGTTLVGSSIRSVNVDYGWASDLVLSSVQNNGYSSQTVNDAIWIKNSGNVGIGTSSPNEKLSVIGAISANNGMIVQGYSAAASGLNCEMGVVSGYVQYNAYNRSTSAYGQFRLDGSSLILNAGSGGNVGIGTTTLPSILTVGDNGTGLQFTNAASGAFNIGLLAGTGSPDAYIYNRANSPLIIGTNNAERMRITSGGNVGIGTSSPSRKLSVSGQTYLGGDTFVASNGGIFFSGDGSYNAGVYGRNSGLDLVLQANNSERMRINSGGFVTIAGTTTYNNSVVSIEVSTDQSGITTNVNSSDTRYHLYFRNTLATVGSISTNTYATSFNTSSDYRLKEDFKPFNGLSILNDIKVYDFKWKGVEQRNYGVVAHEIAEVIPYAVNGEKDGEMHQSVDYSKLVPVLIQAMQEQQKQIDELKAKLENGI